MTKSQIAEMERLTIGLTAGDAVIFEEGYTAAMEKAEALVKALKQIANHKQDSIDKGYLIHLCEGYQNCTKAALKELGEDT